MPGGSDLVNVVATRLPGSNCSLDILRFVQDPVHLTQRPGGRRHLAHDVERVAEIQEHTMQPGLHRLERGAELRDGQSREGYSFFDGSARTG
jgi:hypothetical protein